MTLAETTTSPEINPSTFARFQAGDEEAFERIVDVYHRRLFAYARLRVRPTESAEDIVQEVLIEAFRQRTRIRSAEGLQAWLFTLLRRKIARRPGDPAMTFGDDPPEAPVDEVSRARVLRGQTRGHLDAALAALGGEDREILSLKYFAGLKIREIAEVLSMPEGTVGVRISRGLEKVRGWFESRGVSLEDLLDG